MSGKRKTPPALERRPARVAPRLKLLVICEGDNTEPNYIAAFSEDHGNNLVKISYEAGAGTPKTIVDRAVHLKKQYRRKGMDSYEKNDEIWAVFDVDTHPNLADAYQKARANGIRVAYSNPCFELWAVLHYIQQDGPVSSLEIQKILSRKMPSYKRKGSKIFDYDDLKDKYSEAKNRAETICVNRKNENNIKGNPSTSVFELTELIVKNGRANFSRKIKEA